MPGRNVSTRRLARSMAGFAVAAGAYAVIRFVNMDQMRAAPSTTAEEPPGATFRFVDGQLVVDPGGFAVAVPPPWARWKTVGNELDRQLPLGATAAFQTPRRSTARRCDLAALARNRE